MVPWFTNHLSKTISSFYFVLLVLLIVNLPQPIHSAPTQFGSSRWRLNLLKSHLQGFYNLSSAATPPSNQSLAPPPKSIGSPRKDTDAILLDKCMSRPLSPNLWMEMGMNEFLRNYRNGEKLNLLVPVIFHALQIYQEGADFGSPRKLMFFVVLSCLVLPKKIASN